MLGVSCKEYRLDGAFAQYLTIPQRIAVKLPDGLSFEHAAMVEPVSIAFHAVRRTPLELGDSAVVYGAGMIGQMTVQALRAAGCGQIICVDLDATRLEMARKHGADVIVNANQTGDVPARLMELTDGGADAVFDAVGSSQSVQNSIRSAQGWGGDVDRQHCPIG